MTASVAAQLQGRRAADDWLSQAELKLVGFNREYVRLGECAPRCDWTFLQPAAP